MFRKNKIQDSGENRIRQIEGLTTFCWEIIDLYHQGQGPTTHEPMSPSLAKSMIADEINRQLGEPLLNQEWKHARLRIAGPDQGQMLQALNELEADVVTARWIGAREEEDEVVLYVTIRCPDIRYLNTILLGLEERHLEVRDGTFGLFVR
jgi:hypothetical protein